MSRYVFRGDGLYYPVVRQDNQGCAVAGPGQDLDAIWRGVETAAPDPGPDVEEIPWSGVKLPLPNPDVVCWAYALTYGSHVREVKIEGSFRFRKHGPAILAPPVMSIRETLDYEGEIGVLLRRGSPDRYGFVIVNDLTDRGIQVREFNAKDMAPGFMRAKQFEGSLQIGPVLAVGSMEDWGKLRIDVLLNGQLRQTVLAKDCAVDPAKLYKEFMSDNPDAEWIFVCTGTPEGVLFRSPTKREKVALLFGSGLSPGRARERWLKRISFLKGGDILEMRSPQLGYTKTVFK